MNKWGVDWPKEQGMFWFYGHQFQPIGNPELCLVQVRRTAVEEAFAYIAQGHFLHEGARGMWLKAVLPELPSKANHAKLKENDVND